MNGNFLLNFGCSNWQEMWPPIGERGKIDFCIQSPNITNKQKHFLINSAKQTFISLPPPYSKYFC